MSSLILLKNRKLFIFKNNQMPIIYKYSFNYNFSYTYIIFNENSKKKNY